MRPWILSGVLGIAALGLISFSASPAHAQQIIVNPTPGVVVSPPPVVVAPAYPRPVIVAPPTVVVAPPRVVFYPRYRPRYYVRPRVWVRIR